MRLVAALGAEALCERVSPGEAAIFLEVRKLLERGAP
jgi:hypothetical protein